MTYVQALDAKGHRSRVTPAFQLPDHGFKGSLRGRTANIFSQKLDRGANTIPPKIRHDSVGTDGIDYRLLVENCADILCNLGTDHLIRYISPSAFEILGWRSEEMMGRDFGEFVLPEDMPVLEEIDAAVQNDGLNNAHSRIRMLKKDQTSVWVSINGRCVRDPATGAPRDYVLSMRDITDRKILEEKLSALAMTDALTGLWNRRAFDQALRREWKRTVRERSQLSLLLLDVDHFKPLNDRHGHPWGDACLIAVASAISDTVRSTDIVCRWGGDEIAIILPGTDLAGALRAAEKVRRAIESTRFQTEKSSGERLSVTASIGVATAATKPDGAVTVPQNLLQAADKALYRAKHEGQNRVAAAPLLAPNEQEV